MKRLWGKIGLGALAVVVVLAGAALAMRWFAPSFVDRRPKLVEVRPLAPVTRSSVIVTPVAIALTAIQDALEKAAPRDLAGKPDIPMLPMAANAEIGYTFGRSAFTVVGRPEGLSLSTALRGSFRASGMGPPGGGFGPPGGGFFGPPGGFPGPGGYFGQRPGTQQGQTQAGRDQSIEISGNVVLTARPTLLPGWRLQPNLESQVTIADAALSIMGTRINLSNDMKPTVERTINEQVGKLQARVADDPSIEQSARQEWAKMCRAIPLGAGAPGMPNLWLELRPTRALAAQPRIDETFLNLTIGVQADTRIVPVETKPECPFPAQLEMVPQMEQGRVSIDVPIDIPFTEISRLIEAQLKGKTFPEDRSAQFTATVRSVNIAASGDRLLMSLGVTASETKTWFGFAADATIHVWGRPLLDRGRQVLRFNDVVLDVESAAAFGALSVAARAAVPSFEKSLADNAVIDLAALAANARSNIEAAIAEFRKSVDGVRVDAAVVDLRLADIAFDSKTLRVIAEADGTVRVTVTKLPER
jgi:hypothetical protein